MKREGQGEHLLLHLADAVILSLDKHTFYTDL